MQDSSIVPPPVEARRQLNVVVVGGGVTGVLSSWELARSGHHVTLVERAGLGSGSSGDSAAAIRGQFDTPSTVRGMVYAVRFFECWCEITGMPANPLIPNGYLFVREERSHSKQEALRRRVAMQQESGLEAVRFLTVREIEDLFPYVNTVGLTCATWCRTDGFLIPYLIFQDGAEAARRLGVRVLQNCAVTGAEHDHAGNITVVKTTRGDLTGVDVVVDATNAWSNHLAVLLGATQLDFVVTRRFLYHLHGLNGTDGDFMTSQQFKKHPFLVGPRAAYSRPTPSGEMMLGWVVDADPVDPLKTDPHWIGPGYGTGNPRSFGLAMRQEVARVDPEVSVGTVFDQAGRSLGKITEYAGTGVTSGFYAETRDHNPFIAPDPKVRNLVRAVAFSGHGFMHSPFTARDVAELVAAMADGRQTPTTIELPWNLGQVDLMPYRIGREYRHDEWIVL